MWNVEAYLVMIEGLNNILLVSAHDDAAHVRVKGFEKEISWVRGISLR